MANLIKRDGAEYKYFSRVLNFRYGRRHIVNIEYDYVKAGTTQ